MGNDMSVNACYLSNDLTKDDLVRITKNFKKLDLDKSGSVAVEEILRLPKVSKNPLVMRVLDIFDTDRNGEIDLQEFIKGLMIFVSKDNFDAKLKFAFQVYDINSDGFISNVELYTVLKSMCGNNLEDRQLQQIVDKTIIYSDKNGDGLIDYEEFKDVVSHLTDEQHKNQIFAPISLKYSQVMKEYEGI